MRFSLSISKITPPQFPHVLHRPRLIELLQQHRDKKLILILGPAAQGKSTLAVSWVNVSKTPSAWINLGPEDANPVNLFYLLVQALERALPHQDFSSLLAYPAMAMGPREEIPLYQDWARSLFGLVSNQISIILDGLDQLPAAAPTHRFLQVLLDEAPPEAHFLMLSREIPPLKLEALKMRQAAYILTGEELAFSLEETREFLKVRQFSLPAQSVKQIHRLTEGWAGGLVLLCEGLARLPETDREEYLLGDQTEKYKGDVFKYFGEQIFAALPPGTQDFLIKSTILEVVDPDFIKDFLGVEQAREILDNLAERNLFIQPLYNKKRGWLYRYHLLFRDFLCAKFKTLLGEEQQQAAYLRAGELTERRGQLKEAVKYYLQAGAYPQAVAAIERVGPQLLKLGKTADLAFWLQRLPEALVQERPWLLFYHYVTGRFTGAPEYFLSLQRAHGLFQEQQNLRGLLMTSAHLLEGSVFVCHPPKPIVAQISQAEELLTRSDPSAFPYESATLWFQVGMAKMNFGSDIRQCHQACRRAYLLAKEAGERHLEIHALNYACVVLTMQGEFSAAQEANQQVEALLAEWISPELQALYLLSTAMLRGFQGEVDQYETLVKMAQEQAEKHGLTFLYPLIMLHRFMSLGYLGRYAEALETGQGLLNLSLLPAIGIKGTAALQLAVFCYHYGNLPAARQFATKARQILSALSANEARCEYHLNSLQLVEALISYHLGELDPATEAELHKTLRQLTGISSYLFMVDAHWVLALWRWRQGRRTEAAAHLKSGMQVAARRGSYYSIILSPQDRGRIFTLALELEVEEVWESLPPLLTQLAVWVGPDLERLSGHANPRIAAKAWEIRKNIYRARVPRLRIKTLGGFRLWRGETPLTESDFEGRQPQLLLKAVLAHGAQGVVKDVLLEDLWPEADPGGAEKNFKVNLHRLRKALEPDLDKTFGSSYVHLKANLVSLDAELCQLDMEEFLALIKEGERDEAQGQFKKAISIYKEAVEGYGGDFLPEELYFSWAEAKRVELRGNYSELLHRLAGIYEKQGTLTQAIDCYKQLVRVDPLDELACQRLMLLYAQKGRRSAALKVYQDCCQALKKELNTEPDEVTTAIHQKILAPP